MFQHLFIKGEKAVKLLKHAIESVKLVVRRLSHFIFPGGKKREFPFS
jgi:hypothetical protein